MPTPKAYEVVTHWKNHAYQRADIEEQERAARALSAKYVASSASRSALLLVVSVSAIYGTAASLLGTGLAPIALGAAGFVFIMLSGSHPEYFTYLNENTHHRSLSRLQAVIGVAAVLTANVLSVQLLYGAN